MKKGKISVKLTAIIASSMLVLTVAMGLVALETAENRLNDSIKEKLEVALKGFNDDVYYTKSKEIDITVFEGDTRVKSSIPNAVGTKASEDVLEKMKSSDEYFDTNVDVNGKDYYGYYLNTESGMLFAGESKEYVNADIKSMTIKIFNTAAIIFVLSLSVVLYLVKRISNSISSINEVIRQLSEGDLQIDMSEIKDSNDELGEMKQSLQFTVDKLSEVIKEAKEISRNVLDSSEELRSTSESTLQANNEISSAIEEVAMSATEQSGAVQSMAEGIGELTNSINEIREDIREIEEHTNSVNNSSQTMNEKNKFNV